LFREKDENKIKKNSAKIFSQTADAEEKAAIQYRDDIAKKLELARNAARAARNGGGSTGEDIPGLQLAPKWALRKLEIISLEFHWKLRRISLEDCMDF
jgi:hypothetical protein